ncbi:MAG: hypothetical protein AABX10_02705 [Nanoarchaeota archaeon]
MSKIVNHHPSVAVVKSRESDEFMFTRYDSTYPALPYRLSSNTIGGNPIPKDSSPWETWEREVIEEFNNEAPHGEPLRDTTTPFAPLDEIHKIRDAILDGARPYADFHLLTEGITMRDYLAGVGNGLTEAGVLDLLPPKKREEAISKGLITRAHGAIFSVYYSEIPQDMMDRTTHWMHRGFRLVTEGGLRILTRDQLVKGIDGEIAINKAYLTAHCTPFILGEILGLPEPLMHAPRDRALKLSTPVRESYAAYESDPTLDYKPARK